MQCLLYVGMNRTTLLRRVERPFFDLGMMPTRRKLLPPTSPPTLFEVRLYSSSPVRRPPTFPSEGRSAWLRRSGPKTARRTGPRSVRPSPTSVNRSRSA